MSDMNVEIYTLDYCPFCKRALAFLNDHNVDFTQIKIDGNENEMRRKLGEKYCIEGDRSEEHTSELQSQR